MMVQHSILIDFSDKSSLSNWTVIDDAVMGGRSSGNIYIDSEGNAVFEGYISLENNGGFSSVRYQTETIDISGYNFFILYLRGDGQRYQFRIKDNQYDRHSYITYIETNGAWQKIKIPFSELQPSYRGIMLAEDNFKGNQIEEIGFLAGNKKAEKFKLTIDKIELF